MAFVEPMKFDRGSNFKLDFLKIIQLGIDEYSPAAGSLDLDWSCIENVLMVFGRVDSKYHRSDV